MQQVDTANNCHTWVNSDGRPVIVSGKITPNQNLASRVDQVRSGALIGDVKDVSFRDPDNFKPGALHDNYSFWQEISYVLPPEKQFEILGWIKNRVSVQPYFHPYKGTFKRELYNSDRPPQKSFPNNKSCQPFVSFVRKTLLDRLKTGAISLLGRVGSVRPPHLVLPLTVEPLKPRLCHDARYLNLWMRDMPFSLDHLSDLPRYVGTVNATINLVTTTFF